MPLHDASNGGENASHGAPHRGKGEAAVAQHDFDPEYVFSHHDATPDKMKRYEAIHQAAKHFAEVLLQQVPDCDDRQAALQWVRQASMISCAAVSLDGRLK